MRNEGYLSLGFGRFAERVARGLFWSLVLLALIGMISISSAVPYLVDMKYESARDASGINVAIALLFLLTACVVAGGTYIVLKRSKGHSKVIVPDSKQDAPRIKGAPYTYAKRDGDRVIYLEVDAKDVLDLFRLRSEGGTVEEYDTALKRFSSFPSVRKVLIGWRKQAAERVQVGDTIEF